VRAIIDYLIENWYLIVIPVAVFIVSIIAFFWLRKLALEAVRKGMKKLVFPYDIFIVKTIKGPSSLICLILSLYLGVAVSSIPGDWKGTVAKGLWTLFVVALTLAIINLSINLIAVYGKRYNIPNRALLIAQNTIRVIFIVAALLAALSIWGIPTTPLLLLIIILILIVLLVFREAVPNLFASFQIAAAQQINPGDYIKIEGGVEEGYVIQINWNNTSLQTLDGKIIYIPNDLLVHKNIINYGHPLKKAREPFYFHTRTHLAELTGLKARNLQEMVTILKTASDAMIYYHTHHYLEEHQYLIPELSNDFANWIKDSLGSEILAEKLASVNTFEFTNLSDLRDKYVAIIEEYVSTAPVLRDAPQGREFFFIKSVSAVLPTSFAAHDLREFIEALRIISSASIYFHIFEAKLRLGKGLNDFSIWLEASAGEAELAKMVASIDPYNYTLEGLRSKLIQVIEKSIK
jgi:small-conductance mechanosensitive channel